MCSVRVANDPKAAGRLRHAMRRYAVLQEHVKQGTVKVEFIRDAKYNAADFLTKWVPAAKLKASIAYTSNEAAKPKEQAKTEISTLEVSMIEEGGTSMLLRSDLCFRARVEECLSGVTSKNLYRTSARSRGVRSTHWTP